MTAAESPEPTTSEPTPPEPTTPVPGFGLIGEAHLALVFLTRLPLPPLGDLPPDALARACRAFPLAGALIGGLGGVAFLAAHWLWPASVAAIIAVTVIAVITGFLHEDGLADLADGFGGGRDKGRKLDIMRDSRIGSYGAVTLILALSLRIAIVTALPHPAVALIAALALSRAVLPVIMHIVPPARPDGLAAGAGKPNATITWSAIVLGCGVAAIALPLAPAACAILGAALAGLAVSSFALRQIGGHTGDVLGAAEQVAQTAALLAILAVAA